MSTFFGVVIAESLADRDVLTRLTINSTRVEQVTPDHQTPWLKKWTLHDVEIASEHAAQLAMELSLALRSDQQGSWYADFKDDSHHYIVFRNKVFFVDRTDKTRYDEAKQYGLALGIPAHQVDFHPDVGYWER